MDQLPKRRNSIRLPNFDYSTSNAYFVTICAHNRLKLFGDIVGADLCVRPITNSEPSVCLNDAGAMLQHWWGELINKFDDIETGQHIIMPDHFHGIIVLNQAKGGFKEAGGHAGPPLQRIMQWYKTMTTNEYIKGVKNHGWPPFDGVLWQRGYFDHVIRNDDDLKETREYIITNPLRWVLKSNR